MSLLSWERGLKSFDVVDCYKSFASLLSWERGLKFHVKKKDFIRVQSRSSRGSVD